MAIIFAEFKPHIFNQANWSGEFGEGHIGPFSSSPASDEVKVAYESREKEIARRQDFNAKTRSSIRSHKIQSTWLMIQIIRTAHLSSDISQSFTGQRHRVEFSPSVPCPPYFNKLRILSEVRTARGNGFHIALAVQRCLTGRPARLSTPPWWQERRNLETPA